MSNAYGCDGISTATAERELGLDGGVDENTLQAAIEEQAEDEVRDGADAFRQWIVNYATANGDAGVALVCVVCGGLRDRDSIGPLTYQTSMEDYWDRVVDARRAVKRDYIAYRTSTMPEHERDEIAARLIADREEA